MIQHEGHNRSGGRSYVFKVVIEGDRFSDGRERLEARAASALNHPNIVTVYDFVEAASLTFIAMEFVSGETLRDKLRGGRLPIREAVDIAIQIARALVAAHRDGIVHRDIKPENVMIRDDGLVKVLDFGIAKLREETLVISAGQTSDVSEYPDATNAAWGTVNYFSPEQARREPVDHRSDIFSLGVVLYEMLAGRRPFEGATKAGAIAAISNEEPPALAAHRADLPRAVQNIISSALNKNREARYQFMDQMVADLDRLKQEFHRGRSHGHAMETHRPANMLRALLAGVIAVLAAAHVLVFSPGSLWLALDAGIVTLSATAWFVTPFVRRRILPKKAPRQSAFQGLAPFLEQDTKRFFERERDTAAVLRLVTKPGFRFGVVYGESGCGKTSLITAGLMPELRAAGYEPVVCRSYKDPLDSIVETCLDRHALSGKVERPGLRSAEYVRQVIDAFRGPGVAGTGLIIICDQFEEFFVSLEDRQEMEPFLSFVEGCHQANDLSVSFLFCIRSDFLHKFIAAFDERVPEPLLGNKRYRLREFEEEQAEAVIEKTAAEFGLPVDRELCALVARDLAVGGSVLPPELQIVGSQLQSKRIFTVPDYSRAGGRERLLHGFLEEVVNSTGDRKTAQAVLATLVSDQNTKLTLSLDAIVRRSHRDTETVGRTLEQLWQARLIRRVGAHEAPSYELIHEYLIDGINTIAGRMTNAAQRANRLLRQ